MLFVCICAPLFIAGDLKKRGVSYRANLDRFLVIPLFDDTEHRSGISAPLKPVVENNRFAKYS